MSNSEPSAHSRQVSETPNEPEDQPPTGPNLILIYSLLGLSFLIAIGIAVLIVLPFYHRR
jgi:hypothetical protein